MNPIVKGRFISNKCPDPNCDGVLQHRQNKYGENRWECDGLVDPNDITKELQPCLVDVVDGELRL